MSRAHATILVRQLIECLGGRFSRSLGINVDQGGEEIERWALAATLFGNRISTAIVERTYRVFAEAGVATLTDAAGRSWKELVDLLDRGGYVRYDFRTASRLHALARAIGERHGGHIASLGEEPRSSAELETALDALPGWGPVTVRVFLRELRGLWPGAEPPVDGRALAGAEHLGLAAPKGEGRAEPAAYLRRLAGDAGLDVRDLEAALIRLELAHARRRDCPGGADCFVFRAEGGPDATAGR